MASGGNVTYGSADHVVARGPSPIIWADCPVNTFLKDPGKGSHMFDDFRNSIVLKETASGTDFTSAVGRLAGDIPWYIYAEESKLSNVAVQADDTGVLALTLGDTADDLTTITSGSNVIGQWRTPKVGETKKFWFETRVKFNTITTGDIAAFIGLIQPGQAADGTPLGAAPTAVNSSADYVGFFIAEADGDDLTVVYNEAGAGTAQSSTGKITLAADTYVRIGMKLVIDGNSIKVRFYADGVDLGEDVAVDIGSTNANWPGDTNMDMMFTFTSGAGGATADNIKIDWVRIAQEY